MKTFIIFLAFPFCLSAQAPITKDYKTYAYYKEDESNKNNNYIWLFDGESFTMNFPQTVTGLEAIKDKVEYIAGLSKVDEPTTDNSILPEEYQGIEDSKIIHNLIMDGKIGIFCTYVIGNKRLEVVCSDKGYYFFVTDID